jgi:hypothetical protein
MLATKRHKMREEKSATDEHGFTQIFLDRITGFF